MSTNRRLDENRMTRGRREMTAQPSGWFLTGALPRLAAEGRAASRQKPPTSVRRPCPPALPASWRAGETAAGAGMKKTQSSYLTSEAFP